MPDREKVIAQLTADMDIAKLTGESLVHITRETVETALALLKEQEPVEPNKREVWVGSNGAFVWESRCGACGRGIMKNDRWCTKYCPQCGKKVKWDA